MFLYTESEQASLYSELFNSCFSKHKFITSILYTALACVCFVSDCWVKALRHSRLLLAERSPEVSEGKGPLASSVPMITISGIQTTAFGSN